MGYKYRLVSGTGGSSLFALWEVDHSDEVFNLVATMLHKSWKAFEMKLLCFAEVLLMK
jgi:hypothetical protein